MHGQGVAAAIAVAAVCLAGPASGRLNDEPSDSLIHADSARAAGYTGKGVTVALLDTGIDDHDSDLADSVVAEHCFVPPDGCPNGSAEQDGPGSAQDNHGHGTEIAGLITGNGGTAPIGVAPDARLVVVKVADINGRTTSQQIIAGLNWVMRTHPEIRIVNVSLSGDILLSGRCDTLGPLVGYGAVVSALRAHGTLLFAPSGNSGSHFSITAPACFHDAVAVGAVYAQTFGTFTAPAVCVDAATIPDEVACFSNSSSELDLLAPGAPLVSTTLGGSRATFAGTSAASAEAAAAAALLLQADPTLSADQLEAVLKQTGVPLVDPKSNLLTPRLDVAAALGRVRGQPIPLITSPDAGTASTKPPRLSAPTVPVADLSLRPISFGSVRVGVTAHRSLRVRNTGNGYLTVRISVLAVPFSVRPAKVVIRPAGRATVALAFRPQRAGSYSRPLRLTTDDRTATVITIPVRGTGLDGPHSTR